MEFRSTHLPIDIKDLIDNFLDFLNSGNALIDGEPACEESLDDIRMALRMGVLLATELQKSK